MNIKPIKYLAAISIVFVVGCSLIDSKGKTYEVVERQQWVTRHNPSLSNLNPHSPFTLGNGKFAFTADITGLQSFDQYYYKNGIPLETKARWAWHSRANPESYSLKDASQTYTAYGRKIDFPTNMDSSAGQWLRKNPHDLPLFKAGFLLDGNPLQSGEISAIEQSLNLWNGHLFSRYELQGARVEVNSVVDSERDLLAIKATSELFETGRLSIDLRFSRGYDLSVKNTPRIEWGQDEQHKTQVLLRGESHALLVRKVDNAQHYIFVHWRGNGRMVQLGPHRYQWQTWGGEEADLSIEVTREKPEDLIALHFADALQRSASAWQNYWKNGSAIELSGSVQAEELERRIVLSRYLLAVQGRATIPTQETGLTSSSWYGKHHTEMTYWHNAHWILWGNPEYAERTLQWYVERIPLAQSLAQSRGLNGARWAKMIGPDMRESPGGNPLIIWNQPQFIHLPELLYQSRNDPNTLKKYASLVEQTAWGMSSMLVFDRANNTYNLESPIWIAQEIYDPEQTRNPTFELAYWRYGLRTAQAWRTRLGLKPHKLWQEQIDKLAKLPVKDNKYVSIESIPDTFDNKASRRDHPSMLAAYGMLNDPTVDEGIMGNTLEAVIDTWDWQEKIWGWDYPMIAMTAARLSQPEVAVDILMADLTHNQYLPNGHVPQPGAGLPVYLPANGALLTAVAMMVKGWGGQANEIAPGFPDNDNWTLKIDGFEY